MIKSLKIPLLKFLFAVLCSGFYLHSFSQELIWANKNNLDRKTDFTKVIGQNKYGVYVLKHKNSTFRRYYILEHFDKKMNLLKSKTFRIPNSELEKIVVHSSGIIVFTREYIKGSFTRLLYQTIDSGMNESMVKPVFNNTNEDEEISEIRIDYSPKRDKFLIWYLSASGDKTDLHFFLMNKQTILKEGHAFIEQKNEDLYIGDAVIDANGNLYMIYTHSSKFKSKLAEDFNHWMYTLNTSTLVSDALQINNSNTFLSAYKLIYNQELATVNAFGLCGELDEDDNKGYFTIRIRCSDQKILHTAFTDIDRKLVAQIIGLKNEQKSENLNKFKIRKVIPKTDGGFMVICERMFITTQSDIFYVNGIAQSSYARIFNNDEVLIMNLDSNGTAIWSDIINKTQSSINDGGYYNGIIVMVDEDQIHILYNDRLSANADIIQVSYTADGQHIKKILLNNEQFYALVIPSEYNQVSSNSIVIPVNQNRDFTYIKLLY